MCCLILFKALVKTRVPHASEQIACEGLVHMSLNHVWESSHVSLQEVQIKVTNQAWLDSTRVDVQKMCKRRLQKLTFCYLPFSQSTVTVVTVDAISLE